MSYLQILSGGKIYFDGKLWDRKDLSKIGALIENPPIYENLSARENLKVRQLLLGTDENRNDEVLQIVSLTNTGKKKAGQFSLGMKQRLGIQWHCLRTGTFILDEPTNGLDPIGIEELRELIRSFPEQGITVFSPVIFSQRYSYLQIKSGLSPCFNAPSYPKIPPEIIQTLSASN